jgi:hypothetical protein
MVECFENVTGSKTFTILRDQATLSDLWRGSAKQVHAQIYSFS